MTVNRVETMHSIMGVRKEINIVYKAPTETYVTGRGALGSSEPVTPTYSYTLSESTHFAEVTPSNIAYFDGVLLIIGGINLTASAQTVNYRVKKNTVDVLTGSKALTASLFITITMSDFDFVNVSAGDVIDVYLWTTNADAMEWQYDAIAGYVTRFFPFSDSRKIAYNVEYYDNAEEFPPMLTLGTPSRSSANYAALVGVCKTNVTNVSIGSNEVVFAQKESATLGIWRAGTGDVSAIVFSNNHATFMPTFQSSRYKIMKITYNELVL